MLCSLCLRLGLYVYARTTINGDAACIAHAIGDDPKGRQFSRLTDDWEFVDRAVLLGLAAMRNQPGLAEVARYAFVSSDATGDGSVECLWQPPDESMSETSYSQCRLMGGHPERIGHVVAGSHSNFNGDWVQWNDWVQPPVPTCTGCGSQRPPAHLDGCDPDDRQCDEWWDPIPAPPYPFSMTMGGMP